MSLVKFETADKIDRRMRLSDPLKFFLGRILRITSIREIDTLSTTVVLMVEINHG